MRDQLGFMCVQLSQLSSAPRAETAVVAELCRGFPRGRKPKDGLSGRALGLAVGLFANATIVIGCANPIQSTHEQKPSASGFDSTAVHSDKKSEPPKEIEITGSKSTHGDNLNLHTPLKKDEKMSSDSTISHRKVQSTKVFFNGKETNITLAEGLEIRDALLSYLQKNAIKHDEFRSDLIYRLEGAGVSIDPDSKLMRVGHWLLQNRVDKLVLMNRLRTPSPTGAFLAELDQDDDNQWIITDVRLMRIFRPR